MESENIDWKKRINKDKHRYAVTYDEFGNLNEVHDLKTGEIWFKVGEGEWMKL